MKRYAQLIGLLPERHEEYTRYHAAVWPEVLATIAACNIRNYSIFHHNNTLFAYFEYHGSNYEADMARMAQCPHTQRWWTIMDPMQVVLPGTPEGKRWIPMEEEFHFDGPPLT